MASASIAWSPQSAAANRPLVYLLQTQRFGSCHRVYRSRRRMCRTLAWTCSWAVSVPVKVLSDENVPTYLRTGSPRSRARATKTNKGDPPAALRQGRCPGQPRYRKTGRGDALRQRLPKGCAAMQARTDSETAPRNNRLEHRELGCFVALHHTASLIPRQCWLRELMLPCPTMSSIWRIASHPLYAPAPNPYMFAQELREPRP
ncbi:hypothetical protein SAMN05421665_0412 [Yoonia rosea]|uniref:Uncharacterized protein n=1 Tax=Yoonia rosea TaxID=287098 RepID=A0A1R3WGV2_9RHOB|nr:hypothetical protein SAMN05421665_0412 [Yoonia rosea]